MAMTRERAIDMVAKLLNLAENHSANPHEAATAAAQAQRIMEQHNLERASIDAERARESGADEECELFAGQDDAHPSLWDGTRKSTWRSWLAHGLAKYNDCQLVVSSRRGRVGFTIVGRASDVAVVRYVFTFVEREIDRLAKRAARNGVVVGRTGGNQFRIGAVETVLDAVKEQKKVARREFVREHGAAGNAAIVRLDEHALAAQEALARFFPKLGKARATYAYRDDDARLAGQCAGRSIAVRTGLNPGSSRGARALPGK